MESASIHTERDVATLAAVARAASGPPAPRRVPQLNLDGRGGGPDLLGRLDAAVVPLLSGAEHDDAPKLIVLLLELRGRVRELQQCAPGGGGGGGGRPIVAQSWRLDGEEDDFPRSFLCVQHCPGRTRVDDRCDAPSLTHALPHPLPHSLTHPLTHSLTRDSASLREFCSDGGGGPARAVLPAGMGGNIVNSSQLRREIRYLLGLAGKYGA